MKQIITALAVLAFILTFNSKVLAQETQDVTVSANVQTDITLTKNQDVNFADIQSTSSPVIDPNGTDSDVGAGAQFGKITVSAATSEQLMISWDDNATLGNGSATMTFNPDIDANSTDNAGGSSDLTESTANTASQTDGTTGNLYIYIGGNLGSLSGQATGSYSTAASNGSGPFQITVNYQ